MSFSSTVIRSNRDLDTHLIVEFPMNIGGVLINGVSSRDQHGLAFTWMGC